VTGMSMIKPMKSKVDRSMADHSRQESAGLSYEGRSNLFICFAWLIEFASLFRLK
jgi:hypothetical protein